MKGSEFIKRVRKLGKTHSIDVRFVKPGGKGSHGTLYFGDRYTIVKDRTKEIGPGLLKSMQRDLGIEINKQAINGY